ncbi:MAG: AI-2E family transporter [Vicinamibacterales bacterium]
MLTERPTSRAVIVMAVVVAIAGLKLAEDFIVPVLAAIVVALSLAPIVRRMSCYMPRALAAALVVVLLAVGIGALGYSLSDEAAAALDALPRVTRDIRQSLRGTLRKKDTPLAQLQKTVSEMEQAANDTGGLSSAPPNGVMAVQIVEPPLDLRNYMWWGSRGLASVAGGLVLLLFLVFFLLATGDRFKRKFVRLSGQALSRRRTTVRVVDAIATRVGRYLLHMVMMGAVVGTLTWLAFAWIGVAQAGLWGVLAGILNAVPYFGPTVIMGASAFAAFAQFGDLGTAALVGSVSLVITSLEGMLLSPIFLGPIADVNPVAVFVSFLFWGWLWGPWGVLLAMPLLVIIKTVAEAVPALSVVGELLAS